MKSSAKKVELASVDDLFSTEESRQEAALEKVHIIPLSELYPFPNHPFAVRDDDSMKEMVESIKESGILSPIVARPREGGGYEMISGHRRKHACGDIRIYKHAAIIEGHILPDKQKKRR